MSHDCGHWWDQPLWHLSSAMFNECTRLVFYKQYQIPRVHDYLIGVGGSRSPIGEPFDIQDDVFSAV